MKRLDTALETIRLLAYARLSEETERLLTKGFATPQERHILNEMFRNYKDHGWNGDMDERMEKVYALRTDHYARSGCKDNSLGAISRRSPDNSGRCGSCSGEHSQRRQYFRGERNLRSAANG